MKRYLWIAALLCCLSSVCLAQSKKLRIDVSVTAQDVQAKKDALSYITRELRSLGDVEVVDDGDYSISLIVIKTTTKANVHNGFVVSYNFLQIQRCNGEFGWLVLDHQLEIGGPDDLRAICESIIAEQDTTSLAKLRKANNTR